MVYIVTIGRTKGRLSLKTTSGTAKGGSRGVYEKGKRNVGRVVTQRKQKEKKTKKKEQLGHRLSPTKGREKEEDK